jgi:hypothetical protein
MWRRKKHLAHARIWTQIPWSSSMHSKSLYWLSYFSSLLLYCSFSSFLVGLFHVICDCPWVLHSLLQVTVFCFFTMKIKSYFPLHITWSGVLGYELRTWYLWLYRKLSYKCILRSSRPNKCSPSLMPVSFYKLNDLITHLYSGFHMNIPHPIFTLLCFSRWHILFCTEKGMHQKLTIISALCSADIQLCTFFVNLSLDREEWLASHPWHFITMASPWYQLEPCIWSWH